MGMKKPDRLTKLVDQCVDADICVWTNAERLAMVTLLRREQSYQRARVRRIVEQLRATKGHSKESLCQPAYQLACNDILEKLTGKP